MQGESHVSSANSGAVVAEWTEYGLDSYVFSVMCGQEAGTNQYCIERLKKKGAYPNDHLLMIGDAPGELKAAEENDVLYYLIIPSKEEEPWARFVVEAFDKFMEGTYRREYQEKLIQEFFDVLK